MSNNRRKAVEIVRGHSAIDGAGVHLTRVLGIKTTKSFDPFLMLDGFDSHNPADYIKGFPWHPHRGIETVTYLIHGAMEHGDSLGNKGVIEAGGTQWMSAGSGIIHQEMPKASEHLLGCQLWVNLPSDQKMSEPSYGDISAADVPAVDDGNATVRVISGNYKGTDGAFAPKYVQVTYLDVDLAPDTIWEYDGIANNETLFTYLFTGEMAVNEELDDMERKGCAVLYAPTTTSKEDHDILRIKAGKEGARFALLAAEPLGEPIAWGGPVVMNTREELHNAFDELDKGTFIKHKA
ncbi:MAG: pirin family protein [Porphyromonas sp.]|nr:pirin family protein [Porphyromonas sp.]